MGLSFNRRKPMNRPEQRLQIAVGQFLDVALPRDAFWFHCPNGGARTKAEAGIFKAMGLKAGIPDIMIVWRGAVFCVELKADKNGRLSVAQSICHSALLGAGARVVLAWSIEGVANELHTFGIPLRSHPLGAAA